MFIDSHCHLDRLKLSPYDNSLDGALDAAESAGVSHMLCVAIDLEHIEDVLGIAQSRPNIFASVGVHPNSDEGEDPSVDRLIELSARDKVIAIGESGLDYYYGKDTVDIQKTRFRNHLLAAKEVQQPVIVHTRDAKEDTLELIKEHGCRSSAGVLHCFTEDWDMAQRAMELGYYISLSGIVTFKNAKELQEVARKMPLERLLIETDSPYLAPVPYRGKPNEPKYVTEVAKFIAELKGVSVEEIATITSQNFSSLFKVSLSA